MNGDQALNGHVQTTGPNAVGQRNAMNGHTETNGKLGMNGYVKTTGHKDQDSVGHSTGHVKASNGNTTLQNRSQDMARSNGAINGNHHVNDIKSTSSNGIKSENGVTNGGKGIKGYIFINSV